MLFALAFLVKAVPAAAFPTSVSGCRDGETRTLLDGQRVRVTETNPPDIEQPYGTQAPAVIWVMLWRSPATSNGTVSTMIVWSA